MKQLALDIGLAPPPSLDNFVATGDEDLVHHLRQACSGAVPPVPTFIWGEAGSGKTHLLSAVREALGPARVGWIEPASASPGEFDEAWDAVVLDDCQALSPAQQAAAFNWFINAQSPACGPVRWVLAAADRPPADLVLREDLRTRLGWGLVFHVSAPDEARCRVVLHQAAQSRGVALGDEVLDFMLTRFPRDLTSLMRLLERLDAYALRTQRAITIPLLKSMLEHDLPSNP